MIDITKISSRFQTRILDPYDADRVLRLCRQNTLFYQYTDVLPVKERILDDMKAAPPGIGRSDKSYFGFFENGDLAAVMDLVDGYPGPETAYIGFFMMDPKYQGQGIGTSIINEVCGYLKTIGKTAARLAIDKGNPQSTHFWRKNGFAVISEVDRNGRIKLVAEKSLLREEAPEDFGGKTAADPGTV